MAEAWDDFVLVGIILRPHGLRGEVAIRPETDFPEQRFAVGTSLHVRGSGGDVETLIVRSMRAHLGRPLVAFEGRDTRDDVAPLALSELRVPESALIPLDDGEYYWYQYVGAPVETTDGAHVGRVLRVEPTGGAGMLVVDGPAGEVQVPLVRDLCPTLTPERIVVQAPEGLIELNAPTGRRREDRHRHDISPDGGGRLRRRRRGARSATRPD